jgi:hypothetical protein
VVASAQCSQKGTQRCVCASYAWKGLHSLHRLRSLSQFAQPYWHSMQYPDSRVYPTQQAVQVLALEHWEHQSATLSHCTRRGREQTGNGSSSQFITAGLARMHARRVENTQSHFTAQPQPRRALCSPWSRFWQT